MTWEPPDHWATIVLSISCGFVSGILVPAGEVALRRGSGTGCSTRLSCPAHSDNPKLGSIDRASVQFGCHWEFLRRALDLSARWSRYLTAEQVEDPGIRMARILTPETHRPPGLKAEGTQGVYKR